ncbi:MAG: hypothetical protein ACM30I_01295 [Gemmatimonas sp.]
MILFEIHLFRQGAWKVDSVFDDRDLAVYEAQRIEHTGRQSAVRVIEEIYDEITERTKTRTIWRSSKVDKENLESGKRRLQPPNVPPPRRRPPPPKPKTSSTLLIFNLVVIILGGLGALYLLQHYFSDVF